MYRPRLYTRPSFSFSGCAWLLSYHVGCGRALRELPLSTRNNTYFLGSSGGGLIASIVASGSCLDSVMKVIIDMRKRANGSWTGPVGKCSAFVEEGLSSVLVPDAHKKLSGKLFLSLTEIDGWRVKNRIVNHFESKQDLVSLLMASCYVPLYWEKGVEYQGKTFIDGGFTNNQPVLSPETVTICPYHYSDAHIRPADIRSSIIEAFLLLPSEDKIRRLEETGYKDTIAFLKQNEWLTSPEVSFSSPPETFSVLSPTSQPTTPTAFGSQSPSLIQTQPLEELLQRSVEQDTSSVEVKKEGQSKRVLKIPETLTQLSKFLPWRKTASLHQ
eukprot:TRINITY_DN5690_c0_g1_i1.p1 TRINITY_DN5690_c0_g1~~TRINITY_DN5690_c0_g1_i1.p1  ORF type:complete len:328 (-),score=60.77 TRINITY_DN5690_c0_g1_i1:62-1045(-)